MKMNIWREYFSISEKWNFKQLRTFGEVNVCCFIMRSIWMLEIPHQSTNRILRGRNEIDCLHCCKRLSPFVQIFYHCESIKYHTIEFSTFLRSSIECVLLTSNAFGANRMHFTTSRYHPHRQFVHNQNSPFEISRFRCIFRSL